MTKINFGGVLEEVVTRKEFPLKKASEVLKTKLLPSSVTVFKALLKPKT